MTGERRRKRSSEIGKVALQELVRGCQTVGSVKEIHTRISNVMQLNKRGQAPILFKKKKKKKKVLQAASPSLPLWN